jgi:septum formation protein
MARLGFPFETAVSGVDEDVPSDLAPNAMVLELAEQKARAVATGRAQGLVVGADTTVVLNGLALGKPAGPADAVRMLNLLRDRVHRVFTGVAVVDAASGRVERGLVESDVRMRAYSNEEVAAYVATGEPLDKAGGYGIQANGGALVAGVDGCFNNVVGLPLCELAALLGRFVAPPRAAEAACLLPTGEPCPRL